MSEGGARLAIRLLQDAALRGDIDPWDVDVIAVVDGFLDQLRQRITLPRLVVHNGAGGGGSFEQDLAETSEAFLAASVLVSLKAEVLEARTFPPEAAFEEESGELEPAWAGGEVIELPSRPERHLRRRLVAPPPLQRPVTLGELIRQLEEIAERLDQEEARPRQRQRSRRFSDRAVIEQVVALAHREKLPETTAALGRYLLQHPDSLDWLGFDALVEGWSEVAPADLDCDRVGVFWALLFLSSQGKVALEQSGGLYGPLRLRRLAEADEGPSPPLAAATGPAPGPARPALVA
ncbi:segregation/condensation protein A [Vulcanococcus limneticus]|uniref:segregation/condensation protein A n=1 Tax=Vulcanococcus limneticus TaxID=2170428 RepID=UPI00398BD53E